MCGLLSIKEILRINRKFNFKASFQSKSDHYNACQKLKSFSSQVNWTTLAFLIILKATSKKNDVFIYPIERDRDSILSKEIQ